MALAANFDRVGRILAKVRDRANMTQAALAKAMSSNTTKVFRIESGEAVPTDAEIETYLQAVDTVLAKSCIDYLQSEWSDIARRPVFPHPNWRELQAIDRALARIDALKADRETKAVFVRALDLYAAELTRCANFLQRVDHNLVFVGIISAGKTSAICTAVRLTLGESLPFARRMVLEVGGGRITLCEVRVETGPEYGLIIEPYTDEEVRHYVMDYADHLLLAEKHAGKLKHTFQTKSIERSVPARAVPSTSPEETPWVPEEMARAIRGLSNLTEAGASDLAKSFPNREELAIQVLSKMDLLRRRETTLWCPDGERTTRELEWLQKAFKEINNGRRAGVSLPKRITVIVPRKLFESDDLNVSVIDTRGIEQSSARADIEGHFDDAHAVVLLCTKFGEAPDLATMDLIRRAKALHADSRLDHRLILLVLPRNQDAMEMKDEATNDYVETPDAGYKVKRSHIQRALQSLGAESLPVQFLNATSNTDVASFREFIVKQFSMVRQDYVDRVDGLVKKIEELVEHRTAEERALALSEVMQHLRVWSASNNKLDGSIKPHELLVSEIGSTHPRTLWASVRREGDWNNFDYYYQLGYATRQMVTSTAGERVKKLKAVIENLAGNHEYADATEFLRQISEHVDNAVDELTRQVQLIGQTLYRDALHGATDYWRECEEVYGTGVAFRMVVAKDTNEWFSENAIDQLHRQLNEEINRGWEMLVRELDEILTAPLT